MVQLPFSGLWEAEPTKWLGSRKMNLRWWTALHTSFPGRLITTAPAGSTTNPLGERDSLNPPILLDFGPPHHHPLGMIRYLILLGLCFSGYGATYYVATTGSDANPGSSASPWLTIGKATSAAVAGDTVVVKAGTYQEQVFSRVNGSAGSSITFTGERDGMGNWLTTIDPGTVYTSGWLAASEIGAGVFKLTNSFTCEELNIGNKRVFFAKTTGDISSDISPAYSTGPTTGSGFLTLASAAMLVTTFNSSQTVTWWNGIEAFWIPSGHTTYLRLRDGSNPNGLSVTMSAVSALTITNSYQVWNNFIIRGANCINLNTVNAHHDTIQSNYLATGSYRIVVQTGSHDNTIQNNSMTTDFYGYGNPGAWQFGTDAVSGIRLNQYLVCKYMMGNASSLDDCIFLNASGATNSILGNRLFKCLGVAIEVNSFVASTPIITNTIIAGNSIENCSSIGVLLSEGNTYTRVYSNNISDCDVNFRFHHMGVGGETNRVLYVYRNTSWEPGTVGEHVFFHFTNPGGSAYNAQCWLYQNSFSGGMGTLADNGFAIAKNGLTNCTFVNNIMSAAYYYFSDDSTWVNPGWVGLFDYNEVTPPVRNYPTNNATPGWFGVHNIKSTTNQWPTALGTSFGLPVGSQAVDAGMNIPVVYPSLPFSGAKFGTAWDMGALESGAFYVTTNGNDALDGTSPANAWKTLTKAVSSAGVNTIYVGQGTYTTSPWHLTTSGQTFIASNSVFIANPRFEATDVTLTNFNVGYGFFGGFDSDPVCWFKPGSERSQLLGGSITSAARKNQYGIIFAGNYGVASGVEITNFGVSGICFMTAGISNTVQKCFIHDNPSFEAMTYMWGSYNNVLSCIVSNNNDVELPGSHPDLFQSFFATSLGQTISNNLFINNNCQFGSLQAVDGPDGGPYASNAAEWLFINNIFINQGSKMDVDFRDMRFINNTFYNCNDATSEPQIFGFNWSIYGCGTNGQVINNLFAISGSDPSSLVNGWFGISEGTNTQHLIRNSTVCSNNMVFGTSFGTKDTNSLIGTNWVNGGSPKFLNAPAARIHAFNLLGTTSANQTTNVIGTNTSFTTQLAVGDYITVGPFWTDSVVQVTAIINNTNLWTAAPIGRGVSTKYGGAQSIQRAQGFDPVPDLRLLFGSLAINAGANLAYNPFDFVGVPRPTPGPNYTIGAYEGPTPEVIPTNMLLHITYNAWGGGSNALDSTTYHSDAALFLGSGRWATPGIGPDNGNAAHVGFNQYMGITNNVQMRNLTQGTVAVWASRTNGVGNGYGYILDCGFTFPCTNGWTLGADNGQPTHLYVTGPNSARNTTLTWPDFHDTNYHHYAFTWSNATTIGYYDGTPFQTNNLPSSVLTLDDAAWLCIGAIQHNEAPGGPTFPNAAFLLGSLTDIRMYSNALSASDILNIYYVNANPRPPAPPPFVPIGLPPQMLMQLNFAGWNGLTNVLDTTPNHSDGIAVFGTNGPTLAVGPYVTNSAAHFANNQWLAVTNTLTFEVLTNGTVSEWINYDNLVGSGDYYSLDGWYGFPETNSFWVAAPNGNPSQFRTWKNSGTFTNMVYGDWALHNAWHMYTVTWDGSQVVRWFDGLPQSTNAQILDYYHVEEVTKWLAIGVQHGSHPKNAPTFGWLNGSLADIRIYNFALTATNIGDLFTFNSTNSIPPTPDPDITGQPQNQSVLVGQSATFIVAASGLTPLHYQWKFNGGNVGFDIPNYTRDNCQLVDNNGLVTCVVSNMSGTPATTSPATLTVTSHSGLSHVTNLRVQNAFINKP